MIWPTAPSSSFPPDARAAPRDDGHPCRQQEHGDLRQAGVEGGQPEALLGPLGEAVEKSTRRRRRHGQRREHPAGAVPSGALGLAAHQGHRGGIAGAGAEPEQDPRADQHPQAGSQRAHDTGDADEAGTEEEEPARPEDVDEPADDRMTERRRQVERGDEPGGLRGRCAERPADRDEGDRDDRRVDRVEHRTEQHRRQQSAVEAGLVRAGLGAARLRVSHGSVAPVRPWPRSRCAVPPRCTCPATARRAIPCVPAALPPRGGRLRGSV